MNGKLKMLLLILTVSLLLCACASTVQETVPPTQPEETQATQPAQPATQETDPPPAQEEEPVQQPVSDLPVQPLLTETVLPSTDKATGTLCFYINGKTLYAGGPVSEVLAAGVTSDQDLEQIVAPWHMSEVIRVKFDKQGEEGTQPLLYFVAINPSNEDKALSQCLIYSIVINLDKGVSFGSGKETTPFVNRETTKEEIIQAYGEPTYRRANRSSYEEFAYYEPFSCAYFTFSGQKVRQIFTYYSANIFGHLAEEVQLDFKGEYFGSDAYILMSKYMDVKPYLEAAQEDETAETAPTTASTDATEPVEEKNISSKKFKDTITLGDAQIKLGVACVEMPDPFGEPFEGLQIPLSKKYYVRTGIGNEEEFYLINTDGQVNQRANTLCVKGVITENRNYTNWGTDNSGFHAFEYDGLTQDATIEQILEKYGQPLEIHCTSYARDCFVWLHYEDTEGNTLRFRVDPILDQLVELRVSKYYKGERMYQ